MLTNNKSIKLVRKDRPWLLFLTAILWICGSCFFHEPWEPYEPFVVAVVKSMINTNSWLIPYISPDFPYLDLQPFYFWIFAIPIKILHLTNTPNAIRIINAIIIYLVLYVSGKVGSSLSAYKNGRTTVMILISMVGFVSCAYQLSPNLLVILGFVLFFFSLQRIQKSPALSVILLAVALFLISINFTAQNLYLAVFVLLILPLTHTQFRNREYLIVSAGGIAIFIFFFAFYAWQLYKVDTRFFNAWAIQYMHFVNLKQNIIARYIDIFKFLVWYLIPGLFLFIWTIYRRGKDLFKDSILSCSLIISILLIILTGIGKESIENSIFPIIIPSILLASVEVDSIKIHWVALLNWFSIFIFGLAGLAIAILYFSLDFHYPSKLYEVATQLAPSYQFKFNFWQLLLAILISAIWLFMITRKHIKGREVISNWASGTTFVLVIFMSLCIPWFNSVLSFKQLALSSVAYVDKSEGVCVASHGGNKIQDAIWYYYTNIRLQPETELEHTNCKQAIVKDVNVNSVKNRFSSWHIVWSSKRPVDTMTYFLIERN